MFTKHLDQFNDAINRHGRTPDKHAEHDSVLWHEGKMYDLANEYIRDLDLLEPRQVDWYLRHMRHHVCAILAYVGLSVTPDCVMFEMLDVQSAML